MEHDSKNDRSQHDPYSLFKRRGPPRGGDFPMSDQSSIVDRRNESVLADNLSTEFIRKYAAVEALRTYVRSDNSLEAPVRELLDGAQLGILQGSDGQAEVAYWLESFKRTLANLDVIAASPGAEALAPVDWQKSNDAIDRALGSLANRLTAVSNGASKLSA